MFFQQTSASRTKREIGERKKVVKMSSLSDKGKELVSLCMDVLTCFYKQW